MKLAILYQYPAFKSTVFYRLLVSESPTPIEIVRPAAADIIIYGPFGRQIKAFGPFVRRRGRQGLVDVRGRQNRPLHVFHTIENMRHNDLYDYSVSYDFSLNSTKDIRFPYWMESIDWSHEGVPREKPLSARKMSFISI